MEEKLIGDAALEASVRANPPENARLIFDHVVNDKLQEMIDSTLSSIGRSLTTRSFLRPSLI
ncbi:MAG: hypothetical protein O7G28_06285 [Deltaproteobacteria bacterium]|nr:hypothetical protein [Deltaproteobacteria bacterium]